MAWLSRFLQWLFDTLWGERVTLPEAFVVPEVPISATLPALLPGVQMVAPPVEYFGSLSTAIEKFTAATLEPGDRGGVVGIVTRRPDGSKTVNAAIVQRIGAKGEIVGWLGKSWGQPTGDGWETGLAWRHRW